MSNEEIKKLYNLWQESGSFLDEQNYLKARVRHQQARFVYLDPDETWGSWVMVVIRFPTGIIYGTQCAGTGTLQRYVEGYLVPSAGIKFQPLVGKVNSKHLREVFHQGSNCVWSWTGNNLPDNQREILAKLVSEIPYWQQHGLESETRGCLNLDLSRTDEIAEAWIPVQTLDGDGVLLFDNCD